MRCVHEDNGDGGDDDCDCDCAGYYSFPVMMMAVHIVYRTSCFLCAGYDDYVPRVVWYVVFIMSYGLGCGYGCGCMMYCMVCVR